MKQLEQIKYFYFKLWLDKFDAIEFRDWINSILKNNKNIPKEVFPIINLKNDCGIETIKKLTFLLDPDFKLISEEGEFVAMEILKEESIRYLNRQIAPVEFCKLIVQLDSNFLDFRDNYPEWLGYLYDECDWCDDSWTFESRPSLASEVSRNLEVLKKKINTQPGV